MSWKISLLYILPQHLLSRGAGWLSRRRNRWFKNYSIRWFIQRYGVNLDEVANPDINTYRTFNDFFIRTLRPDVRPLVKGDHSIASPVDGNASAFGDTQEGTLIQAKGSYYLLNDLLADPELVKLFNEQASYCTQYLAPQYYHRVHMPLTGKIKRMVYVPGRLFAVNQNSVARVSRLLTRNERVICHFETEIGDMIVIFVGAYLVGNIHISWHGQVAPTNENKIHTWVYENQNIVLEKGQEIGYFTLGSTVITLFKQKTVEWNKNFPTDNKLNMGELLAYSRSKSE